MTERKNKLLPIINNNISSNSEDNDNGMDVEARYLINTRIFSDCWSSYQINDFREMGFILNRINHSVWFGYGDFHNNTIEGMWSQIKRHSKNFSGISIEMIDKLYINDTDKIKYLNGWICFSLLLREFEKEKLNKSKKIDLLMKYLKI